MNILLVHSNWYSSGGDWTYIQNFKKIFESNGHTIIPFSTLHHRNEPTDYDKYFIKHIDYNELNNDRSIKSIFKVFINSIYSFASARKLNMLLDEIDVDCVFLHNIHNVQTLSILRVLKKRKIRILWRVLDYKIICPNRTLEYRMQNCTDCVSGNYMWCIYHKCKKNSLLASAVAAFESYFNKSFNLYSIVNVFLLQNKFAYDLFVDAGYKPDILHVVSNPLLVDLPVAAPDRFPKINNFLYFGRISAEKGLHFLVQAFNELPEWTLKIVGDGPQRNELIDYVNTNNIKNVIFIGPVWGDSLNDYIDEAIATIVPSVWFEPSPYSILQSLARGTPVLASKIGGIPDLVKDGVNGFLFKPGSTEDIVKAVKDIAGYPRGAFFTNCIDTIKTNHNPNFFYKKIMKIIDEL